MAVQGGGREDVYATLLLTDTYLPGALVLAHSLRDASTTKKLAALVTLDSVSAEAITQLKSVYDYVIPVPRIRNAQPANLLLMNRTDLHSAFTKINLWSQTQFRKIVYIDADVVAYRAPDELFNIPHPFSAAPDIGWPDLFNTGVMVLSPNMGDYYAMMAMAERGISFDGADQGLINTHFRNNYNRISFTYNVTPSAHYQYIPAYRHFQSSINMVHFIGSDKPWFQGRHASTGSSPFDEMTGRWWAVYDRHYRVASPQPPHQASTQPAGTVTARKQAPELVQYLTKGEYQPKSSHIEPFSKHPSDTHHGHEHHDYQATTQYQIQIDQPGHQPSHQPEYQTTPHHGPSSTAMHTENLQHQDVQDHQPPSSEANIQHSEPSSIVSSDVISSSSNYDDTRAETGQEQIQAQGSSVPPPEPEQDPPPFQPPMSSWDAQRHPPPAESKPEAMNFPATTYEMSKSTAPFIAPQQYPRPPKDMWYEVPKTAPAAPSDPLKPIFPWEANRPKPSRIFVDEETKVVQEPETHDLGVPSGGPQPEPETQPSAESSVIEASTVEQGSQPVTPTTPTIQITPSDPWTTYTRTNAWDDVPEIERYVDSMQKHRRSMSLKSLGVIRLPSPGEGAEVAWRRRGSKVTDFPSEAERPSLPVTPAPINRPNFWGGGPNVGEGNNDSVLPSAVGVPGQGDWDPIAQLEKLAQQHSDELLKKLGGEGQGSSHPPPKLSPLDTEKLVSPTYVTQSTQVLSPQPVKGNVSSSSALNPALELETAVRLAPSLTEEGVPNASVSTDEGSNSDSGNSIPMDSSQHPEGLHHLGDTFT
ncbi:glycosyltransferase family 8 protein [Nemania abortiva]|nr:glycosyltransferase family 8 protein [Nemania abortiva]